MADRRRQYCPCKACSSRTPPLAQLRRTIYNHVKKDEAAEEKRKFMKNREKEKKRKAEEKKNEQKKASAKAQLASLSTPSAAAQVPFFSIRPPSSLDQPLRLEESDSDPDISEFRARLKRRREAQEERIRRVERRAAYSHILKVCQDAIDQLDAASPETELDKVRMQLLSPEPNFPVKRRHEDPFGREEQIRRPLHRERRSSPAQGDMQTSPAISRRFFRFGDEPDPARPSLAERSRVRRQERDERRRREQAETEAREGGPSASHIKSGKPDDESGQDEGVLVTDLHCTKCGEASLSEEELELKKSGMEW